jgi:hypothetical protein
VLWVIAALALTITGTQMASRERHRQTLEAFLATTLSSRRILREKVAGLSRLRRLVIAPPVTFLVARTFVVTTFASRGRAHTALLYLAWNLAFAFVLASLCRWLGLVVGYLVRQRGPALLAAPSALGTWCAFPFVVALTLFYVFDVNWYELAESVNGLAILVSPALC